MNSSPASTLLSKRLGKILQHTENIIFFTSSNCCSNCEKTLAGIVPFEKFDYKYCSMNCVRQHRTKLNA